MAEQGNKNSPSREKFPKAYNKEVSGNANRPPTTSYLRSAMYYQNRIIAQEPPEVKPKSPSFAGIYNPAPSAENAKAAGARMPGSQSCSVNNRCSNDPFQLSDSYDTSRRLENPHDKSRRAMDMDTTSVTMDARGIEIVVTDTDGSSQFQTQKKNKVWKRIYKVLQDNRMKGRTDAEDILNVVHPEDYRILKKVLNIMFLGVGITLLIAVVVVIIYSYVRGASDDSSSESNVDAGSNPVPHQPISSTTVPAPPSTLNSTAGL